MREIEEERYLQCLIDEDRSHIDHASRETLTPFLMEVSGNKEKRKEGKERQKEEMKVTDDASDASFRSLCIDNCFRLVIDLFVIYQSIRYLTSIS